MSSSGHQFHLTPFRRCLSSHSTKRIGALMRSTSASLFPNLHPQLSERKTSVPFLAWSSTCVPHSVSSSLCPLPTSVLSPSAPPSFLHNETPRGCSTSVPVLLGPLCLNTCSSPSWPKGIPSSPFLRLTVLVNFTRSGNLFPYWLVLVLFFVVSKTRGFPWDSDILALYPSPRSLFSSNCLLNISRMVSYQY